MILMIKSKNGINTFLNNMLKLDKDIDGYLNEEYGIHPFRSSFLIALTYCIVGGLWILFSDKLLGWFVKDIEVYRTIELYKGWLYVFITTILIFLLIIRRLKQFELAVRKIQYNLQELNSFNEELVAMEEELKGQVEELHRNRTSLMISEERYELAVEGADCGIWDYDAVRDIWFFSTKFKMDLGYSKDEIENSREAMSDLLHPDDKKGAVEKLNRFLAGFNGTTYDNIFRMRCKDGNYKWVQSKAKAIYDSDGRITRVAGSHIDITNLKLIEHRLEWLAYYDNLTELPNRIAFEKKMNETIIDSEIDKFALVYLDIDDFKNINDALGHVAGDYFLKYVANSLKHQIDDQDFIARLSGDEFAILYYNVDKKEDVEIKLNHLLEVIKKPWEYMDRKLYFSFSAGATMYPDDGQDSLLLLKNSDIAMYAAKKNQSIRYNFYNNEMNETNLRRIEMIHELKNAIDQREFELYYQPINQLNNESIYGVEALIRWNHPEKGMISPMEFIPLAEETGLICEIDYWVLETAFIQKRKWEQECSLPIKMSINISGKSLVKVSLLDKLSELIERVDIKREDIQIEITETSYMENVEASAIILERIKEMGIKIALDDFGTGYSSLTYLEILPIDIVKLDRKFIMNPLEHAEECVIVQNLIKLTHDLNLKILAEGIETREQLNFLRENGCDLGQGYLFSRPLPASTIEEYMYTKELNI